MLKCRGLLLLLQIIYVSCETVSVFPNKKAAQSTYTWMFSHGRVITCFSIHVYEPTCSWLVCLQVYINFMLVMYIIFMGVFFESGGVYVRVIACFSIHILYERTCSWLVCLHILCL